MAVPEEIRKVPRPKNTVVECTGRPGRNMYPVRERGTVKYVKGGNPQPHNGKVVGHIIGGRFVPVTPKVNAAATMLSYGTAALIRSLSRDIEEDLLKVYPVNVTQTIMAMAALKVERPDIKARRYASAFERSFVSVYHRGAAMSESSVSGLLKALGMDEGKRRAFYAERAARLAESSRIVIDGTLKTDSSTVNDLSHFSYKGKSKGTRDISVIYAYDLETREPLCCEVFPGNHVDSSAYANFVTHNAIRRGVIIDDKGFPVQKIESILAENPQLHYLTPIKRNDQRIRNNGMLEFDGVVRGISANVLSKKKRLRGGKYLYAFKDVYKASLEHATAIERVKASGGGISKYNGKAATFGVVVYESDLDISCEEAYAYYKDRWELELLFKAYKSELSLRTTNVQGDFSVFASEFVNFIATLITGRVIRAFEKNGLLKKDTYGEVIDDLNSAWRVVTDDEDEIPKRDDSNWIHVNVRVMDMMEKLGLCR